MAALLRLLFTALIPLARELFKHFGGLFLRFFLWLKVAKFGLFLIKVGVFLGLITAMAATVSGVINGLSASMPPVLADGINRVLPDNFANCVSALVMAKLAVFALHVKDRLLGLGGI